MAKEIDIKLKTTADKSGVQIISGSLKGLKATAAEVSSSVILSARQINERWREYWRSTRENATKELSKISTAAQKEGAKVGGVFQNLAKELGRGGLWAIGGKISCSLIGDCACLVENCSEANSLFGALARTHECARTRHWGRQRIVRCNAPNRIMWQVARKRYVLSSTPKAMASLPTSANSAAATVSSDLL